MSQLLQRRVELLLVPPVPGSLADPPPATGITIRNLRVQFKVDKTITKEPNTADISVTNLSQTTRALLQSRGTKVVLSAGYEGSLGQLFSGDSRSIDHVRKGADWVTRIQCGSGERQYRFATVSQSFAPGTPKSAAVMAAISAMQLDPGNATAQLAGIAAQYVSGYAMHGKASAELDSLLSGLGLEWSIQDGQVQVLPPGQPTAEDAVLVNAQSGLLDSPEHGAPEVVGGPPVLKLKSLINPLIRPGRTILVQSQQVNSQKFLPVKVNHSGDTKGGEWYTQVEARAL